MEFVVTAAFADELTKIAKDEAAIYSPALVAHEAAHAQAHGPGSEQILPKLVGPSTAAARGIRAYTALTRLGATLGYTQAPGAVAPLLSAVASIPELVDEVQASRKGHAALKSHGQTSPHTQAQYAAMAGTYALAPFMDLASMVAGKAGLHPLGQLALREVGGFLGNKALSYAARNISQDKITADEARSLIDEIASKDVDLYTTRRPISGGSFYVPPFKSRFSQAIVQRLYSKIMDPTLSRRLSRRGGILLAPLTGGKDEELRFKLEKDVVE